MIQKIRVLLTDEYAILRDGLRRILADFQEFAVVGEAKDDMDALQQCKTHTPDLVLLGLPLPRKDCFHVLRTIKRRFPLVKVLMLTVHCNQRFLMTAMADGADGYCLKDAGRDELLDAMHLVCRGRKYFGRKLLNFSLPSFADPQPEWREHKPCCVFLSRRENEILRLVVQGYTNRKIAATLLLSDRTVDNHCTNIREKLGVHSKQAMTLYALRAGLTQ